MMMLMVMMTPGDVGQPWSNTTLALLRGRTSGPLTPPADSHLLLPYPTPLLFPHDVNGPTRSKQGVLFCVSAVLQCIDSTAQPARMCMAWQVYV